MPTRDSARISPTAHYTSFVWFQHGMSHPALATRLGRVLHAALRPMNAAYERFAERPNLDMMLLARHRVLDHLLARAIESGEVEQVLEVAAGLSPRGTTFARRYPVLRYVEADLPDMAADKRARLARAGLLRAGHEVVALDALADEGEGSVAGVCARHFDPARGTAIVTEGLLGYFDGPAVDGMFRRFARTLAGFPRGLYLSDLALRDELAGMRAARGFRLLLSLFARGRVHIHFADAAEARASLEDAGFGQAALHLPEAFPELDVPVRARRHVVRLLEARVA